MITISSLTYTYPSGKTALRDLSLTIPTSSFVLVTGVSGAGKSTLLRAMNGLIPQFYGGVFSGSVQIDGQSTLQSSPRKLAQSVGFVFQDPEAQFIVQTVEDEICFGMENLGVPIDEMRRRLDDILTTLNIAHLRKRQVDTLSGGEQQRVAIASALVLRPRHLILDEPTSQLDPPAAHILLDTLVHLNCNYRLTIMLAEHRLERVLNSATHLLHLEPDHIRFGTVREMLPFVPLRPPLVQIALERNWQPLPLTVDAARAFLLDEVTPTPSLANRSLPAITDPAITTNHLTIGYGTTTVLSDFNYNIGRGEIVGLLGVNGAGKSTLLKSLVGLIKPQSGDIRINGQSILGKKVADLAQNIGYVPQNPNSVLFAETLREEVQFTLRNHGLTTSDTEFLTRLGLGDYIDHYPRDLSGGERQRAALAAMLAAEPPIILLDEPTRGLDYVQKQRLADLIRTWSSQRKTILIATHDVEWIAGLATRCTVLERGRIIADGDTPAVLLTTPGFNTQLGELFGDPQHMTLENMGRS
jgi:energy-coupling factor transport system ATP-binding protein